MKNYWEVSLVHLLLVKNILLIFPIPLIAFKLQTKKKTNEQYNLSDSNYIDLSSYPGELKQKYELDDFTLNLSLIFVSDRSALIRTEIENTSDEPLKLDISWEGSVFDNITSGDNE